MGLHVHIFRPAHFPDCTNGGISSIERDARGLCLVNVEGPSGPCADYPAAMLVDHRPFGDEVGRRSVRIVPAEQDEAGEWRPIDRWWMFGGHYAASSDGRFGDAVRKSLGVHFYGAVAIHDRWEA